VLAPDALVTEEDMEKVTEMCTSKRGRIGTKRGSSLPRLRGSSSDFSGGREIIRREIAVDRRRFSRNQRRGNGEGVLGKMRAPVSEAVSVSG
jgi:hypothetical protein